MSSGKDMFIINKIFPNAKDIFAVSGRPISEIKNDCLFVFDTNSLILPYTTSSESLDEIKKVYTKIINEKRFFIPGQVAREFARIRPEKIKEVFQQLTKSRNSIPALGIGKYPLLEGIKDYDELSKKEKEINSLVKDYAKQLGKLIEHVKEWSWNDPVSQLYKSLFNDDVIYDIELDEEKIKEQLDYRYENKIPPGYEDRNKDDGGIGDLLIWFTILELAEKYKKDIVFISGDEKKDWFYQVDKQSLYPKFELITEFRGKAPDRTFSIIKLSELLELYGVNEKVIKELEEQEVVKIFEYGNNVVDAVKNWILDVYERVYSVGNSTHPDFFTTDEENNKICFEIISLIDNDNFRIKLESKIERIESFKAKYDKVIIVLVYRSKDMVSQARKNSILCGTIFSDFNIEVLAGYINVNKEFIKF
ncbi:PIN domain-containing protein [Chryseobacterium sp.]|uniref:PIN domain-containing protein n=1 Tax=Chryseobacterium sp. TaxID=1871047 RepID=UPI0031D9EB05